MALRFFILFIFLCFRSIPKRLIFMFRLLKSQHYDFLFLLYTIPFGRRLGWFAFFVCWQFTRESFTLLFHFLFLNRAVGTPHRM